MSKNYVIVRTYSAGVFAGNLVKRTGKEGLIKNARRLWYWKGANSLSELAEIGVKYPNECKFPIEVSEIRVNEIIEILKVSPIAEKNIKAVPIWKN
jgi:hypothetical protein